MRHLLLSACLALVSLLSGTRALAAEPTWTPEKWFDKAKSPRIANYHIQAALDWEHKTLEGSETISWRNAGTAPTQEFPLHLYLNAFRGPQSLFQREGGGLFRRKGMSRANPDDWGYCQLQGVSLGGHKLDGHFGEDETVYWVRLPKTVAPGETIQVLVQWTSRFPRNAERTGWGGDSMRESHFLMGAQWFPKVGVYQGDHWICHPYHAFTEFFSDFGVYDVELSMPNALLLAHVGTQTNFKTNDDVTKDPKRPLNVIWKLHAEDVHDFAWAVAPKRSWACERHTYRGVQVFYYYQPEHGMNLDRQRFAIEAALKHAGEWYFPYPYPTLSVVDVPDEAASADGMEYPTLITSSSTTFDPLKFRASVELTAIHEFGHQYFYGMLASNEAEEPWLDEGITTWFTKKAMERAFYSLLGSRRFQVGLDILTQAQYWSEPSLDPVSRAGYRMFDFASYNRTAYSKASLVLDQLEATLGRPVMEAAMGAYAQEMQFKHPTSKDLKRILERVSGRDLTAFWRDFVEGTEVLDVAIQGVKNLDTWQGGWMLSGEQLVFAPPQVLSPGKRGSITLVRRGGQKLPITLWVRLENRNELRMVWDGQDRWTTFEFESPVVAAVLDPDGNYPMLKDRLHASYTANPTRRGLHYWSQMVWSSITAVLQGAGLA